MHVRKAWDRLADEGLVEARVKKVRLRNGVVKRRLPEARPRA